MEYLEMKNAITEIRNPMDGFYSGLDTVEERFDEFKDMLEESFSNIAHRDKEVKNRKRN